MRQSSREAVPAVIIRILLPLLAGALIYLAADPDVMFLKWLGAGTVPAVQYEEVRSVWLTVLRNYGCDMMWALALTSAVVLILGKDRRELILSGALCLVFETVLEAAQTLPSVKGTFDPKDILLEWLVTGTLIFISARKEKQNEKGH